MLDGYLARGPAMLAVITVDGFNGCRRFILGAEREQAPSAWQELGKSRCPEPPRVFLRPDTRRSGR
jgi:hypothetical protein